ncbi:hypothetical protein C8R42DRAFT_720048 [Lentinula raphanica]|nr:hypothetical protein C8R42DRAFT_720048 [Lentinula raphanica]
MFYLLAVEFYFGDSNLPYDKHMWKLHTNYPGHWVPISEIATFKKMQQYVQRKDGLRWIAESLKASQLLEVDRSYTKVRRKTEVKQLEGQFERSLHVAGFGTTETPDLHSRIIKFFESYAPTNEVRMQRTHPDKFFRGSVFVEFCSLSGVDAFLNANPKPLWKGVELIIMPKTDYIETKKKEKGLASDTVKPDMVRTFNAFRIPVSRGGLAAEDNPSKPVWFEHRGKKLTVNRNDNGNGWVDPESVPFLPGSMLVFEGVGTNSFSWNDIKIPLKVIYHGRIPFITHTVGQDFGFIGFSWQLTAQDILFVRYLVQRIGGRKIKWSRAHIEDERELQIRRAQSKARAALRYADNYPLRAHNFGHGAKRARRSNVGNGYKPVLVQRRVTRSMTKALEDIKADLSEDEQDELDMTSLEDQTSSLCLYSDDPRDTTSNVSTSKRKAESSVTHDSSPQRKRVRMFSPSDSDIAEELAVFKLLSVEEPQPPQPSSTASGSAGPRSKKDLVKRNSTLSVRTSRADKENQDIANQRNLQSDDKGKRKRTITVDSDGERGSKGRKALKQSDGTHFP